MEDKNEAPNLSQVELLDLSDAPRVPEEKWKQEDGRWDEGLVFVSASGRYNGPLRNNDEVLLVRLRSAIQKEQDQSRYDQLHSALIRGGLFHLCPEDFVVVDPRTEEGKAYLARGLKV